MTGHAVVIAGGGPTGLMLAGELALAGRGARSAWRAACLSRRGCPGTWSVPEPPADRPGCSPGRRSAVVTVLLKHSFQRTTRTGGTLATVISARPAS